MVRTLDLAEWAGRWVAIDKNDEVQRDSESLEDLFEMIESEAIEGLSILRAPVPGEAVVYGLG
jgi:hypothetical protein